jgi:iron complex transport system substrate-binding protein
VQRLLVLIILSFALMFGAACGDSDETGTSSSASPTAAAATSATTTASLKLVPATGTALGSPTVPPPTASTATNPAPLESVLAPYRQFGTDAKPGEFPRTIKHAMGETRIATAPTRVVALDTGEIDALVQLGIKPVGAADYGTTGLPEYLRGSTEGATLLGSVAEPDLELIASLKPDLILSSKLRHEKIYSQLSAIAPTVMSDRPGVTFRENFALYSQAVGKEQQAADVVARYESRVKEVSAKLASPRPAVSIVQVRSNVLRFYQRSNFLGTILTDLGLPRSKAQNVDDFSADLGLETIGEYADGDVIILALQSGEQNPLWKELHALPLWRNLPAVQNNQVLTVDDQTWIGGVGYGAAFLVLDGIEQSLGR